MTSLTTEDFPYTIAYVLELLGLSERELMTFVQILSLSPRKDEKTGRLIFTHRDIDILKKANEMKKQGEDPDAIARQLGGKPLSAGVTKPATPEMGDSKQAYISTVSANQAVRSSAMLYAAKKL
jgi:DNA-binding transcriptional MerR regulator